MQKVILLGLDGAVPFIIEEYLSRGELRNFARIREKGVMGKMLPFPSAVTPGNWAAIATGSYPGTNGISDFAVHIPGNPFTDWVNAFLSDTCQAQFLWDHLSNMGYKSATISFPGSYPRNSENHLSIGDYGQPAENSPQYMAAPARCFVAGELKPVGPYHWKEYEEAELKSPSSWGNLPDDYTALKELVIEVRATNEGRQGNYLLYLLMVKHRGEEKVIISPARDFAKRIDEIGKNVWSRWIEKDFLFEGKKKKCVFRFRAGEISGREGKLLLYLSPVCLKEGFSRPEDISTSLARKFGPYCDILNISKLLMGWLDAEGIIEELREQGVWQAKAAVELLSKEEVKVVFSKWHAFDKFYHFFFHKIDPVSPLFNREEYKYYEKIHSALLKIADEMVGIVLDNMDKETTLFVVSDHGLLPSRKFVWVNNLLAKHGLLKVKKDGSGKLVIDFSQTKAVMHPYVQLWVNLKGRDPEGIVEPGEEYEKVRDEVIKLLRELRDPETGRFVFAEVFRVEDGGYYGLWGERDGDIRFFTNPGYSVYRSKEVTEDLKLITPAVGPYTGDHGSCRPTTRFGRGSEIAFFSAVGAGIKPMGEIQRPVFPCDLVPTISHLLKIEPPCHSEGAILREILL